MSVSVLIGLVLALATAITAVVGNLMRHTGAITAPPVVLARPVRSSLPLFRSRWYVWGIVVANLSWAFHVGALALAPISLAQSVIAAGLVFLAVIADRVFHLPVTRREWLGVAMAATGLAILAATLDGTADDAHSDAATTTLLIYVGVGIALGIVAALIAGGMHHRGGPMLGVCTGCMFGASDVTIKSLTTHLDDGVRATLIQPMVPIVVVLSLVGLVIGARSLQLGPPVTVIALTAAAGNVITILSGPIVFREPFPREASGVVLRLAALTLVIVAAILTPPRAETEAQVIR